MAVSTLDLVLTVLLGATSPADSSVPSDYEVRAAAARMEYAKQQRELKAAQTQASLQSPVPAKESETLNVSNDSK